MLGSPYRWGGDDPIYGWDCSGAVIELLKTGGWLSHHMDTTAQGLYQIFKKYPHIQTHHTQFSDLVFFGRGENKITHVGMSIGSGLMFEAGGGTSRTRSLAAAASQNAYVRIRPLKNRKDLVGILRIDV